MTNNHDKDSMTQEQAADYLGLHVNTLYRLRRAKKGPSYSKVGGKIRYTQADLDAYKESCKVTH